MYNIWYVTYDTIYAALYMVVHLVIFKAYIWLYIKHSYISNLEGHGKLLHSTHFAWIEQFALFSYEKCMELIYILGT
jgi:hypothetical protein